MLWGHETGLQTRCIMGYIFTNITHRTNILLQKEREKSWLSLFFPEEEERLSVHQSYSGDSTQIIYQISEPCHAHAGDTQGPEI